MSCNIKFNFVPSNSIISFRHGNKVGFYLFVTPKEADVDCVVEFQMKHDYIHTILGSGVSSTAQAEGQGDKAVVVQPIKEIKWITHQIKLNLGKVSQTN